MCEVKVFYNNWVDKLSVINMRHMKVFDSLEKLIPHHTNVLDLGCGAGLTSRHLAQYGRNVVGIDISDKLIEYAQKYNSHFNRVKYIVGDITDIKLNDKFDAIVMVDILEHLERIEKIFDLIDDVSHETTIVYINIPNPDTIRFLQDKHPNLLQIVDNPVETSYLIRNFKKIGFIPSYFNFYWYQYTEFLFVKKEQFEEQLQGLYGD